jgi:transcriptional regulator with XRE-family HTH domain
VSPQAEHHGRTPPELRTLADKLDWLIRNVHPPDRGPYSNRELAAEILDTTGEKISGAAIWELRTGKSVNPTKRVIEALARTLGAPVSFFFEEEGDEQVRPFMDQVELLALIRDSGIDQVQLRQFLTLSDAGREAIAAIIEHTARTETRQTEPERRD